MFEAKNGYLARAPCGGLLQKYYVISSPRLKLAAARVSTLDSLCTWTRYAALGNDEAECQELGSTDCPRLVRTFLSWLAERSAVANNTPFGLLVTARARLDCQGALYNTYSKGEWAGLTRRRNALIHKAGLTAKGGFDTQWTL